MIKLEHTVITNTGIHAKTAGMIAKLAKDCSNTKIEITIGNETVKATQMMKLMAMKAAHGDKVHIQIDGPDEKIVEMTLKPILSSYL